MPKKYLCILFLTFVLVSGCSNENDRKTPEQSSNPTIFSDQLKALEKAKEVERVIQTGMDKRRQAIDE